MDRHCVYAIKSAISGRIYIGQTDDIDRRISEQNKGRSISTRTESPWELVAGEYFENRSEARWCENQLKKSKGKRIKWFENNHIRAYASESSIFII